MLHPPTRDRVPPNDVNRKQKSPPGPPKNNIGKSKPNARSPPDPRKIISRNQTPRPDFRSIHPPMLFFGGRGRVGAITAITGSNVSILFFGVRGRVNCIKNWGRNFQKKVYIIWRGTVGRFLISSLNHSRNLLFGIKKSKFAIHYAFLFKLSVEVRFGIQFHVQIVCR